MPQVNADSEAIRRIKSKWAKVQGVANNGYSTCSRSLESAEQQIKDFYGCAMSTISTLQSEADRLERAADAEQQEYDRQVKEMEEGRSNSIPYYSPDMKREKAAAKRKLAKGMSEALEEFRVKCKAFSSAKEQFLSEFRKIATGGSGSDDEQMELVLTKSIENLDEYGKTNI